VDPLLSTGFPLVLLGVSRLAEAMGKHWETERFGEMLRGFAKRSDDDLLATARLIGSLYGAMDNFPLFVSLSHLYFAAASYTETARRLGKPHLAAEFLLRTHPTLVAQLPRIFERARSARCERETKKVNEDILCAIEPINVAGLGDPLRRNWYPVDANALMNSAAKLEADRDEVIGVLSRCGFLPGI
jgi:FADH2 O2-dependent halogenase